MENKRKPVLEKLVKNVSNILKVKEESFSSLLAPPDPPNFVFIRRTERASTYNSCTSSYIPCSQPSHRKAMLSHHSPSKISLSPSLSPIPKTFRKRCEKYNKLIDKLEHYESSSRDLRLPELKDSLSVNSRSSYLHPDYVPSLSIKRV